MSTEDDTDFTDDASVDDPFKLERLLRSQVETLRAQRKAKALLDAEDAPTLQWWSFKEFLDSPAPEPLVLDFLYRDSLARIYGAPGGGKTFFAIDLCMHIALSKTWCGRTITGGPVVYVMAEGQRVNGDRIRAWVQRHKVNPAALADQFIAVPHAVLLTEPAMKAFLAQVAELQPAMVVLDTKNAMMVGEENSASDSAVMRRALDAIRTTCSACVVLIDHTGYEGTRARGSSAVTAAMDTEICVTKDNEVVTAKVTRDKAAEAGTTVTFNLRFQPPSAVLVEASNLAKAVDNDWKSFPIPRDLENVSGKGAKLLPDMARYMAFYATGDADGVGLTRQEVIQGMSVAPKDTTARMAWSQLLSRKAIEAADGCKSATGRHVWVPLRKVAKPVPEGDTG